MPTRIEQMMCPQESVTSVVAIHAGAAPGANTNLVTAFSVSPQASALRVTVCLTTGSILDLRVTDGTTAYSQHFNGGVALTAGCLYTFTHGVRNFSTQAGTTALLYSYRVATDSVLQTFNVEEVVGPVI